MPVLDDSLGRMPAQNEDSPSLASQGRGDSADRRMTRAQLMGRHTHATRDGAEVHVWIRAGRYLARGRHENRPYGVTLGSNLVDAEAALRHVLNELDNGTFVRTSVSRRQPLKKGPPARLEVRELINRFLEEKRKLRGKQTVGDYHARLMPALEFLETPANRKRWPYAADLDRAFALELRGWLYQRRVTRNGHVTAESRRMSANQVRNVLGCMSTLINWARSPEINLLPLYVVNPFNHDLIGPRPQRDPLAPPKVPMKLRIEMVQVMNAWQLAAMTLPFVIPDRPEDFTGLMISEVTFNPRELIFGTRMGGDDFNKCGFSFRLAWPAEIEPILRWWMQSRSAGPLLLRRTVIERRRQAVAHAQSLADINTLYETKLARAKPGTVQAPHDRKMLFRQVLRDLGGVSGDELAREFKSVLEIVRPGESARFYDLRGSTLTDLKDAGVDSVFRRYVTAHSLKREILGTYESQTLERHMAPYFEYIRPLLTAIRQRAADLGIAPAP